MRARETEYCKVNGSDVFGRKARILRSTQACKLFEKQQSFTRIIATPCLFWISSLSPSLSPWTRNIKRLAHYDWIANRTRPSKYESQSRPAILAEMRDAFPRYRIGTCRIHMSRSVPSWLRGTSRLRVITPSPSEGETERGETSGRCKRLQMRNASNDVTAIDSLQRGREFRQSCQPDGATLSACPTSH